MKGSVFYIMKFANNIDESVEKLNIIGLVHFLLYFKIYKIPTHLHIKIINEMFDSNIDQNT